MLLQSQNHELEQRVRRFLSDKNYQALGGLNIRADSGSVRLSGHVSSFYEKQLAISCVKHVPGVFDVRVDVSVG